MQQSANIVDFSCGNSCITCVDKNGEAFGLGNNEFGQLALPG
jgi:alpha-tubulin suppressor-like RCC1 family protein